MAKSFIAKVSRGTFKNSDGEEKTNFVEIGRAVNFQLGSLLVDYKKENNMISAIGSATFVEEIAIES